MIQLKAWWKNLWKHEDSREWTRQNARLALILRTGKLRLWIYRPSTRHYYLLSAEGTLEHEYNPVAFSQLFQRDDFEVMRSAIFDICEGASSSAKVTLCGNAPQGEVPARYEVSVSVLQRDSGGHPTSLLGIQHDITEEYRRQQEADQLLVRYHTVFNSSLLDMIFYDKNGVLTDINDRACAAFNVPSRQMVLEGNFLLENNPMFNRIPLEQMENTRTSSIVDFADYTDEKYKLDEFQLAGKMYYESTINPIRNERGELEGIYMAGRDVTEAVESYHRQQAVTERLRQATKGIEKYVADVSYALRVSDIRLVNYYPQRYLLEISNNVGENRLRLSQLRCIRLATMRFRRAVNSVLNRMDHLTPYNIVQMIETEIRDKQGRQIWLLFNLVPIIDAEGRVERYFGMCRNMTQMVETERQLAVESKKAHETELLKQAFLTNMSYEIRTPLNTIVGFAELFSAEHEVSDEGFFVEQIKVSTQTLLSLVNDILFLSQLDANMVEYKTAEVDFALVFESHCQLGLTMVSPDVEAVIEHPYNSLVVAIDNENVGKIIQRLCSMSALMTHQGRIKASYEYRRGELTFSVEDSGIGIDAQTLPHAFDRFSRNGNDQMCGTGLDLPIVQSLAEQMGGSVDIQSELNKGTTIWVSIPCTATVVEKKRESQQNPTEL